MAERVDSVHEQLAASGGRIFCVLLVILVAVNKRGFGCVAAEDERVVAEDERAAAADERLAAEQERGDAEQLMNDV